MYYNSTVNESLLLRGSGKIEIATYGANPSWLDIGSASGIKVAEALEFVKEESDNAEAIETLSDQAVTGEFNAHSTLSEDMWDILRGSLDDKTVTAAEAVEKTKTLIGTSAGVWYEFEYQNASGLIPTVASVVGNVTSYAAVDDYNIVKNGSKWGIVFVAGTAYSSAHSIVVTYTVTPAASVTYKSGKNSVVPFFMIRITTKASATATPFVFTGYKCQLTKGKSFDYGKDSGGDKRLSSAVSFKCYRDSLYNSDYIYSNNGAFA